MEELMELLVTSGPGGDFLAHAEVVENHNSMHMKQPKATMAQSSLNGSNCLQWPKRLNGPRCLKDLNYKVPQC
jgi:hypothetical protein